MEIGSLQHSRTSCMDVHTENLELTTYLLTEVEKFRPIAKLINESVIMNENISNTVLDVVFDLDGS